MERISFGYFIQNSSINRIITDFIIKLNLCENQG